MSTDNNSFIRQGIMAAQQFQQMMVEEVQKLKELGFVHVGSIHDSHIFEYRRKNMKTETAPNNAVENNEPAERLVVGSPVQFPERPALPRQTQLKLSRKERRKVGRLMQYAFGKGEAAFDIAPTVAPGKQREAFLEVAVTEKHVKRFKLKEVQVGYVVYARIDSLTLGKVKARSLFA